MNFREILKSARKRISGPTFYETVHAWFLILNDDTGHIDQYDLELTLKELKFSRINVDPLPRSLIRKLFLAIRKTADYENLIDLTELRLGFVSIDPSQLTDRTWLALYHFCCLRGLFHLGFVVREKAVIATIHHNAKVTRPGRSRVVSAMIDSGSELSDIKAIVNCSSYSTTEKERINLFLNPNENGRTAVRCSLVDKEYESYLSDKTLAIVGPAQTSARSASEIDSYDEVVRLNFAHDDKGCDPVFSGEKTTISYFNTEMAREFDREQGSIAPDVLSYICLKDQESLKRTRSRNEGLTARKIIDFEGLSYCGALNMGPIAVLDLVSHSNSPLKIFNMDLMLTLRRFSGYYPSAIERKSDFDRSEKFKKSTVRHDPMSQYVLFKRLWNLEKIEGDERFSEVMALGTEGYMAELQKLYLS